MGLFGGKTKVHKATSVSRVIRDSMLPNSVKTGAVKAIFAKEDNADLSAYVLEEISTSVGIKVNQMYNFAAKDTLYGVPSKQFVTRKYGQDAIEGILKGLYGHSVKIEYSYLAAPNILHFAWERLVSNFGYDTSNNELRNISTGNQKAYLDDIRIVLPTEGENEYSSSATEQWGISAKGGYKPWEPLNANLGILYEEVVVGTTGNSVEDFVTVTYGLVNPDVRPLRVTKTTFNLQLPITDLLTDYYQVCFTVDGIRHYWSYRKGSGAYPALDSAGENATPLGTFLPIVHYRDNYRPVNLTWNSPEHKYNKRLSKYLGINYDTMADEINTNPDITSVVQAVMMFAVPANTGNPHDAQYLFEFFNQVFEQDGSGQTDPVPTVSSLFRRDKLASANAIVIQDKTFKCSLSYAGISYQRKSGKLGSIGTYQSTYGNQPITRKYFNVDTGEEYEKTIYQTAHTYRKQITEDLYDEIQVAGMTMTYWLDGQYTTVSNNGGENILVPVDKAILDRFSVPDRETIVARSMHMIFNSLYIQELAWYETGAFQALLMIVSIAVTIFSGGAGAFTSALATGGTVALAAIWNTVLAPILTGVVLDQASKLFVKVFGEEFTFLLALAAVVYGSQFAGKSTFADVLVKLGNSLINEAQASYAQRTQDVLEELTEFQEYTKDMYEQLEATSAQLLGDNLLKQVPYVVLGESPAGYFNRTVHSGNIGAQSINMIRNYVDLSLQLPKPSDTLQLGNTYGREFV